jgi:hypothetical protein
MFQISTSSASRTSAVTPTIRSALRISRSWPRSVDAHVLLRVVRFEKERQMSLPVEAGGDQGCVRPSTIQPARGPTADQRKQSFGAGRAEPRSQATAIGAFVSRVLRCQIASYAVKATWGSLPARARATVGPVEFRLIGSVEIVEQATAPSRSKGQG